MVAKVLNVISYIVAAIWVILVIRFVTNPYTDPVKTCQFECKDYLNTNIRMGNTTNIYSCSCDNK